jgi:hypothetical protein
MIINGAENNSRGIATKRSTIEPISEARKVFAEQAIAVGRHRNTVRGSRIERRRFKFVMMPPSLPACEPDVGHGRGNAASSVAHRLISVLPYRCAVAELLCGRE